MKICKVRSWFFWGGGVGGGGAVTQLVEELRYKPESRGFYYG